MCASSLPDAQSKDWHSIHIFFKYDQKFGDVQDGIGKNICKKIMCALNCDLYEISKENKNFMNDLYNQIK